MGGSLLMDLRSCFLRPPHGAVWRGRALGMARWRYVAWHALVSLGNVSRRGGEGHVTLPNPVGCRGSPRSLLRGGKCVSCVLQHTVGCGMEQIQHHPGEEHGTGMEPAFPLHQGHSGSRDPHSLHLCSGAAPLSHSRSQLHSTTVVALG